MPINPEAVGEVGTPKKRSWTSKDALLYAVGVGAGSWRARLRASRACAVSTRSSASTPSSTTAATSAPTSRPCQRSVGTSATSTPSVSTVAAESDSCRGDVETAGPAVDLDDRAVAIP